MKSKTKGFVRKDLNKEIKQILEAKAKTSGFSQAVEIKLRDSMLRFLMDRLNMTREKWIKIILHPDKKGFQIVIDEDKLQAETEDLFRAMSPRNAPPELLILPNKKRGINGYSIVAYPTHEHPDISKVPGAMHFFKVGRHLET